MFSLLVGRTGVLTSSMRVWFRTFLRGTIKEDNGSAAHESWGQTRDFRASTATPKTSNCAFVARELLTQNLKLQPLRLGGLDLALQVAKRRGGLLKGGPVAGVVL